MAHTSEGLTKSELTTLLGQCGICAVDDGSSRNQLGYTIGAAISSLPAVEKKVIVGIKGADLELKTDQSVFYVHGADLMSLTHQVFERCIK